MALRGKLSNNKRRKLREWLSVASRALQQSDADTCLAAIGQIRTIQPENADAAYLEALLACEFGQWKQAEGLLAQAVEAEPGRADFHAALAGIYLRSGNSDKAAPVYRRALQIDPQLLSAQLGLAGICVRREAYDEAITILEQARKRHPGDVDIRMGLFQACHHADRIEQAREHLEVVLANNPGHAAASYNLALMDMQAGDRQGAESAIRRAIANHPGYAEAYAVLVDLKHFSEDDDDVRAMQKLYAGCPPDSFERMQVAFALAKVRDDQKRYSDAFALLQEANLIRHRAGHWNEAAERERMRQVMDAFPPGSIASGEAGAGKQEAGGPIFVVGMPRSGTTLVEQILAAHPDVGSCGENRMLLTALEEQGGSPVNPAEVAGWEAERCAAAAAAYLRMADKTCPGVQRFTDKTLSNIACLGIMARLFPKARIVHVRRDAMATCWSIYRHNLTGSDFDYGYDLAQLGRYFRMHEEWMAHWRQVLPEGMLIEVDYEQLVDRQREQTGALLAACGLAWNESCIDFQNNRNRVQTASILQVRQPIYRSAIDAWRHYGKHLQPLVEALGEGHTRSA